MPLYEYRCRSCSHRFEVLQRIGQGAEGLLCPRCGAAQLDKQFSTFAAASGGSGSAEGASFGEAGDFGDAGGGCGPGCCSFGCDN